MAKYGNTFGCLHFFQNFRTLCMYKFSEFSPRSSHQVIVGSNPTEVNFFCKTFFEEKTHKLDFLCNFTYFTIFSRIFDQKRGFQTVVQAAHLSNTQMVKVHLILVHTNDEYTDNVQFLIFLPAVQVLHIPI